MLKRLKIHRFRHVAPGTELEFSERYNVLLGKNGTGKTTLLDLISMVLRSDFSSLRGEEFDIEYEFEAKRSSSDQSKARVRFVNELRARQAGDRNSKGTERAYRPQVSLDLSFGRGVKHWRIDVEIDSTSMRWRHADQAWEDPNLVDVFAEGFAFSIYSIIMESLFSSIVNEGVSAFLAFESFAWDVEYTYRFDESLDVFECITEHASNKKRKAQGAPSIGVTWRFNSGDTLVERYGISSSTFFPREHYEPDLPESGQTSARVEISNRSAVGEFNRLAELKAMTMSLSIEQLSTDAKICQFGHAEFLFTAQTGSTFNHHALSYGQKRLLAFLYYLDANPEIVIADELVNGMHHDWIKACLELMGSRQAFLTSQNPLLLDYLPLESIEQVQRSFIQCKVQTTPYMSNLVWSNLDADEAGQLLADYEVGIQHVGELLRVRGLW